MAAAYNRQPINEIKQACSELDFQFVDMLYEKYTYVLFICNKHAYKGIQKINREALMRWAKEGKCLCDYVHRDTEDLRRMSTLSPEVEIIGEYQKSNIKLECKCKVCDHHWFITPNKLQNGRGCPICKNEKLRRQKLKPHSKFVEELHSIQPTLEILSEYQGGNKPLIFKCKVCGLVQELSEAERLLNYSRGCKRCKASAGERRIADYLNSHNIAYEAEKSFIECKSKRPLRFDFYLPIFNACIEYQGEQHYRPVDYSGRQDTTTTNKNFQELQKRDEIKKEFCKMEGIKLLEIPYWESAEINNILNINLGINDCKP